MSDWSPSYDQVADWTQIGGGLDADSTRIGRGFDVEQRRSGRGRDADRARMGRRLDASWTLIGRGLLDWSRIGRGLDADSTRILDCAQIVHKLYADRTPIGRGFQKRKLFIDERRFRGVGS